MMSSGNGENAMERVRNELDVLKRRVARLEATEAQLDRDMERVAEQPTPIDRQNFRHNLNKMKLHDISEMRLSGKWGNYDPRDASKSSWKVREAGRYITAKKERRQRRLQWIGIAVSGIIALAGVIVAILGL